MAITIHIYYIGSNGSATSEKPEIHINLNYTVRPFEEVEEEYLSIYEKYIQKARDCSGKRSI